MGVGVERRGEGRLSLQARLWSVALFAASMIVLSPPVVEGQTASSEITGQVTDSSGGVLPGVTVTVIHLETGTTRQAITDQRGSYVFQALNIGQYAVAAELEGFKAVRRQGVTLAVGQRATLDFQMELGTLEDAVIVTAEAPLVNTTKSEVASNLDLRQMHDLPLVGRDWLSMTALAPGVRSSATGVPTAGAQGNQRTKILVDSNQINRNFNFGATNFEYSQEAIREVLVITNRMSAEYARAGGGVVTAVTKSGTNQLHGSLYGFFRDGKLNAKDWFTNRREPFSNKVYGTTIGGPLIRNKAFYFGSIEYYRKAQTATFGTGIPVLDVTYPIDGRRNVYFGRFDVSVGPKNQLQAKVGRDSRFDNHVSASPGLSAGWHVPQRSWFAGFTLSSVFGTRTVNELTYQYFPMDWERLQINTAPGLIFPSARIGTLDNALFQGSEHMSFVRDTYTRSMSTRFGEHNLKSGAEFIYVNQYGQFGDIWYGNFLFNRNPTDWAAVLAVTRSNDMAGLQSLVDQGLVPVPTNATFALGDARFNTPQPLFGAFVQDDWRITPKFTLNLGLRYDVDFGAFLPDLNTRYTRDHGAPRTDVDNVAPRVGFAYNIRGDNKTVIRGGFGRYFDSIHNNFTFAAQIFNGDTYAQVVTFPGAPARADFMSSPLGGLTLSQVVENPALAAQNIRPMGKDLVTSHTDQMAIGVAHQLTDSIGVQADYLHIIGRNESYYIDTNLYCSGLDPLPVRQFGRPDSRYNVIRTAESEGRSGYDGLQVGLQKRFSANLQWGGSYTLSWSRSNSGGNSQTNIPDPCNLNGIYGPSDADQRHRATFNVVYQFPLGLQASGVVFASSGQRFLTFAGRDVNGDLQNNDLARSADGSKWAWAGGLGEPVLRVDGRVSKMIHLPRDMTFELIAEAINIFNRHNYNTYNGNQSSRIFLQPVRSTDLNFQPFQAQLAVRFSY